MFKVTILGNWNNIKIQTRYNNLLYCFYHIKILQLETYLLMLKNKVCMRKITLIYNLCLQRETLIIMFKISIHHF